MPTIAELQVFALASCDSCRKALRELRAAGYEPEVIDVRRDGLSAAQIEAITSHLAAAAINKRSKTWRELDEAARGAPLADLISQHPTVMKRPVIVRDGQYFVGWDEAVRAALI